LIVILLMLASPAQYGHTRGMSEADKLAIIEGVNLRYLGCAWSGGSGLLPLAGSLSDAVPNNPITWRGSAMINR